MEMDLLNNFRLVGGTSLSLQLGHRVSVDIDLFTDAEDGTMDYMGILKILTAEFDYVDHTGWTNEDIGNSCFIGRSPEESIKLDLFYTDLFKYPIVEFEKLRLASLKEIAAMKLDIIGRGGRKKDFWDLHALLTQFDLPEMLQCYETRYPYNFSQEELILKLTDFSVADKDPDPICLQGKYWELIKLDVEEVVGGHR